MLNPTSSSVRAFQEVEVTQLASILEENRRFSVALLGQLNSGVFTELSDTITPSPPELHSSLFFNFVNSFHLLLSFSVILQTQFLSSSGTRLY